MHMIGNPTNAEGRTSKSFGNTSQKAVHLVTHDLVLKISATFFRREDNVNQQLGERLRHNDATLSGLLLVVSGLTQGSRSCGNPGLKT